MLDWIYQSSLDSQVFAAMDKSVGIGVRLPKSAFQNQLTMFAMTFLGELKDFPQQKIVLILVAIIGLEAMKNLPNIFH